MRRLAVVIGCAIALALPLAGQGIATADTWGGCQGNTCTVGIDRIANIIITQDGVRIPLNLSNVNVTVPACWMAPNYSQAQMLAVLAGLEQAVKGGGGSPAELSSIAQYIQEVRANTSSNGSWWTPEYLNTPGGIACLANLPPWVWVPAGQVAPAADDPLTPLELAELAEAALRVPKLVLKLNPAGKTYVNLPTFLWTGNPALITVTATVPGYLSETVTATPGTPQIDPGTTSATPYTNCGPNGSHYSAGSPEVTGAGPGSQPDCGAVYQAPSTAAPLGFTMQVTIPWIVTWTGNGPLAGVPPVQVATIQVRVDEIQSLNNGPGA
jgi:enoyl reductase